MPSLTLGTGISCISPTNKRKAFVDEKKRYRQSTRRMPSKYKITQQKDVKISIKFHKCSQEERG